ncbi:MAG: hypothetical protein Q7S37_04725 [bacterium]|nr:hypothetical protein [bacterium]
MLKKYLLYLLMGLVAEGIIRGFFYFEDRYQATHPVKQKINIEKVDPKYRQDLQDLKDLKDTINGQ